MHAPSHLPIALDLIPSAILTEIRDIDRTTNEKQALRFLPQAALLRLPFVAEVAAVIVGVHTPLRHSVHGLRAAAVDVGRRLAAVVGDVLSLGVAAAYRMAGLHEGQLVSQDHAGERRSKGQGE
jgi:hypothetical protein